jgi:plastocyanin
MRIALAFALGAGLACVLAPLAAQTLPLSAGQASSPVQIDNFVFSPARLVVKAGTTVTWTNRDDIPHAVASKTPGQFKSKVLDTDESYSFTFATPGEYSYFCSLHPHMTGTIVVKATTGSAARQ